MKTILMFVVLIVIVSFSWAEDWETYEMVNLLLLIREPSAPVIHENYIIFTADSNLRRVGVSFAHEDFRNVYWFRRLMIPQDRMNPIILPGEKVPSPYRDSGLQFFVFETPVNLPEVEYRLVINGLWTIDPHNPNNRRDPVSGLGVSVINVPPWRIGPSPFDGLPNGLRFTYNAQSGESVTIAGSFNNWDPFMYELREGPAGVYSLTIPLPPGTYQYVFFHRGERFIDTNNPRRIYTRDGRAASEITVP